MNPELLLAQFNRISDAPDNIPRLRHFILNLAVRGKLAERDPNDEPASKLVNRMQVEESRLIKEGSIRRRQPLPPVDERRIPFPVPEHWAWLQLNGMGVLSGGMTPSKNRLEFWNGEINWFSPKDIKSDELAESELKITPAGVAETGLQLYPPGCLFIVARSGILKRTFPVAINRVEAAVNQDLKVLTPFSGGLERYLQIMFQGMTDFILSSLVKTGTTVQSLKYEEFEFQPLPLPPLAEQHRIVAKVDELMVLCDRLEAAQGERENQQDRLTASSLHHLNSGADAEAFRKHAHFYINHLASITARPEQVPALREAIFNLAVRGRIVLQDESDESVSVLLERIRAEQKRLVDDGAIPPLKLSPPERETPLAFDVPKNWETVVFGRLCNIVTSGSRGWAEYYSESGPKFIRAQNIRFGRLRLDDLACVNPPKKSEGTRTQVSKGDLLVVITGAGVTNPALVDKDLGEAYVSQHVALIKPTDTNLSAWLLLCLMAPMGGRAELVMRAYGAGKPGLNLDNIRSLPIPLPPLPEQHRIVARVNALMDLCDQLAAQLGATRSESGRLLEAALHNALMTVSADSQTSEPHALGSDCSPWTRNPAFIT